MIVLHAAPMNFREIGGMYVSIPALVAAQNRLGGVEAALLVTTATAGSAPEMGFPLLDHRQLRRRARRLTLPAPFDRPDLVVFHSTYIPAHARIAAQLRRAGIPYVICPRGGMTQYAQAYRPWKKRLGNLLFFNQMVRHAAALNCLTPGEAATSIGWDRPRFVVGNGTQIPAECDLASPGRSGRLSLVFVGRLHVQYKGLDALLEACHMAGRALRRAGAVVELHGPDWQGSRRLLAGRIEALGLADVVTLAGSVIGREKARLLRRSDVFLHPSRSEGHPMAVLEALAHGLPCLLTPVTQMAEEVSAAEAGWTVEPEAQAIAAGIERVLSASGQTLQDAGRNARRLAVTKYRWDRVAAAAVEAYRSWAA